MQFKWLAMFSSETIINYSGDELISHLRSKLTDLFLLVFTVMVTFVGAASILRSIDTGWQTLYTAHITMISLLWLATIFRHRIPASYKASLLIGILLLAGIGGYLQFGLAIQNSYLFTLAILFSVLMLPLRATIIFTIVSTIILITMVLLFLTGTLSVDIDIIAYTKAPTTSILKIVSFIFLVGILFAALSWIIKILIEVVNVLKSKSAALKASQQEVQRIADVKVGFLANMSHEIRTPLNGIMGFINQLHKTSLDPKQKEFLDIINSSSNHLLGVINDILDLSKINSDKLEINLSAVWIRDEIDSTVQLFQAKAKEKSIQINYDCDDGIKKRVNADILRIKQVISNLLSNAIKFTPKYGTITLKVSQSNMEDDSLFYFSVKDTGIGMNKEACQYIFEPFKQAEKNTTQEHGGTGLGLSISHKLVELMGGKLEVTSTPNKGSLFFFSLRLQSDEAKGQESLEEIIKLPTFPLSILVAEDNKTNQILVDLLLKEDNSGHDITFVGNGEDAVQAVKKHRYDIIFMDIRMPIMDGEQATLEIRSYEEQNKRPKTYIVALTANAFKEDEDRYMQIGMNAFLAKPIIPKLLFSTLRSVFKER